MTDVDGLSFRELLLEVRTDVRALDAKLDNKADRSRVHELVSEIAAINMTNALEKTALANDLAFIRGRIEDLPDHESRIRGLERFRYALPSVSTLGLLVAVVAAVAAFTH